MFVIFFSLLNIVSPYDTGATLKSTLEPGIVLEPSTSFFTYWIRQAGLNYKHEALTRSTHDRITDRRIENTKIFSSLKLQYPRLDINIKERNHAYFTVLLLLAGDTELNPGPRSVKYPCLICKKPAKGDQQCLQCDTCDGWYHTECMNMPKQIYDTYANTSMTWICCQCGLPNVSSSLFNSSSVTSTANQFSSLSDTLGDTPNNFMDDTALPEPDGNNIHIGSPSATSTPRRKLGAQRASTQQRQRTKNLKCLLINCDGICNKLPHLEVMIESHKPDVIIGTESHLKPDIMTAEITPRGFTTFRKDRIHARKGGVFIMIKDDLVATECNLVEGEAEVLYIELNIQGFKRLVIGSFYRPPKSDPTNLQELERSLANMYARFKETVVILGGDFNLADIDWTNRVVKPYATEATKCALLLDICNDFFLDQLVTEPTRISGNTKNILDLVLTSHPGHITNCEVTAGISDHDAVTFLLNSTPKRTKKMPRKIYLFSKANIPNLQSAIDTWQQDFLSSNPGSRSVQENWDIFKSKITLFMENHIPSKMSKPNNSSPWITNQIRKKIKRKQKLYNKAKQSGDWGPFRDYQKSLRKEIRHNYWSYQSNMFTGSDKADKAFWKFIRSKKQDPAGISPLKHDEKVVFDATRKAKVFNQQFQSVFTAEDTTVLPNLGESNVPTMENISITPNGVQKLLEAIKTDKATGPDGIPGQFLKSFAKDLAPVLCFIFQQSLNTGQVPSDWRLANITPIFKKGDKSTPSNYRPVSVTSICSKLIEHIIFSQIMHHYDTNNVLHDSQHGFRAGRSCETQLIMTAEDLARSLDQKDQVDAIALDFSKAFDRVPHERLLLKLRHYGIRGELQQWIRSFLTDRSQRVVVDGQASDTIHVSSGVPQGTVLGPLLFITFINDISHGITSKLRLFADDCLIYNPIHDISDHHALQRDLDRLHQWSLTWQMKFNTEKCHLLRFSLRRNNIEGNYLLGNTQLTAVQNYKYLGLTFSHNLSWQKHIDGIASKSNQMLGLINRNLRRSSQKIRQQAFFSLVRPRLEYCATVWNPSTKKSISKIEAVQRRAARFVLQQYRHSESVSAMIQQLQWSTLERRRHISCLSLLYKIQNGMVAITPDQLLTPMAPSITRQYHPNKLKHIHTRTQLYQNSYFPQTVTAWNALPNNILASTSLGAFAGAVASIGN